MTETVEAVWNYDLEAGKQQGVVLLVGFNSDGSKGIAMVFGMKRIMHGGLLRHYSLCQTLLQKLG